MEQRDTSSAKGSGIVRAEEKREKKSRFFGFRNRSSRQPQRTGKKQIVFVIDKRQKFVIGVGILSLGLFIVEFIGIRFVNSGFYISFVLAILTVLLLFWSIRQDLKDNFTPSIFILPLFYSLAFGLFYFLIPARIYSRIILTILFAFGLYSLFLSQNIFVVASIRTIQLLSGARIVSFVITLLSFFFLSNILYSLHLPVLPTLAIVSVYTYLLTQHSVWTYTLTKSVAGQRIAMAGITLCVTEAALITWFWPSSPTVIALFLTGFFYTINGLYHVWLERRLFRNVLWEYVWVGVIVFLVLLFFSSWGK